MMKVKLVAAVAWNAQRNNEVKLHHICMKV